MSGPEVRARSRSATSSAASATPALAGVDLTARAGEIHALLGPNGAGKTTLLRVLTGLVDPSEGSVRVLGADARAAARARGRVGLVPAGDRSFYLRISGTENLRLLRPPARHAQARRVRARAREVLEDVGLTEAAGRPVGGWSHGMQKRLSVARALLTAPPVAARRRGDARPRSRGRRAHPRADRRPRRARRDRRPVGDAAGRRDPRLRLRGHVPRPRPRALRRLGRGADGPRPPRAAT